jgi:HK97 family phage portal protein
MASLLSRLANTRVGNYLTGKGFADQPTNVRVPSYAIFAQAGGANITPRQAWIMYKSVGTFAKIVDLIADQVSTLEPTVYIDGELQSDGYVYDLLSSPGFGRDRRGLIKELAVQYLVTGAAHTHVIGNVKHEPAQIDVLATRHSNHVEGEDGWPALWEFHEGRRSNRFQRTKERDPRYIENEFSELVNIYDIQGDCRGVGLSRLQSIQDEVELKLQGLIHNKSLIGKGARLTGLLSFKSNLSREQKADIRKEFSGQMAGAGNAGGVMVSAGGDAQFVNMMMNPRDMDWAALTKAVDETVVARYNVPVTLYAVDAQTHNNYATAWHMLYDNSVLPTYNVIMGGLAQMLKTRMGVNVAIKHDKLSSTILADKAVERAKELYGAELLTLNEAREIAGYEPLAGGDVINDMPGLVPEFEDIFAPHLDNQGNNDITGQPQLEAPPGTALN